MFLHETSYIHATYTALCELSYVWQHVWIYIADSKAIHWDLFSFPNCLFSNYLLTETITDTTITLSNLVENS